MVSTLLTQIITLISMLIITLTIISYRDTIQQDLIKQVKKMKSLGAKFSDTQLLRLKDVSLVVGTDGSKLARAALRLGLNQIQSLAARDPAKAKELVLINDAKSK